MGNEKKLIEQVREILCPDRSGTPKVDPKEANTTPPDTLYVPLSSGRWPFGKKHGGFHAYYGDSYIEDRTKRGLHTNAYEDMDKAEAETRGGDEVLVYRLTKALRVGTHPKED